MGKKFYDEDGYVIGALVGEASENFAETPDKDAHEVATRLVKKPESNTNIFRVKEFSNNFYTYIAQPMPLDQLSDETIIDMFKDEVLSEITVQERPSSKKGYKLVPSVSGTVIVWEYVVDENAEPEEEDDNYGYGDYLNPFIYKPGMKVQKDLWYKMSDDNIWEAIKTGVPTGETDPEYFDIIQ